MNLSKEHHEAMVSKGFWDEPNLLEKKMLIISELGEAIEAHRKGNFCTLDDAGKEELRFELEDNVGDFEADFVRWVKDTYEDELADSVLRIWDYMEYIEYVPKWNFEYIELEENVGANLYKITEAVCNEEFDSALLALREMCKLDWHIEMKMAFNKTRPHRHGKKY